MRRPELRALSGDTTGTTLYPIPSSSSASKSPSPRRPTPEVARICTRGLDDDDDDVVAVDGDAFLSSNGLRLFGESNVVKEECEVFVPLTESSNGFGVGCVNGRGNPL